MIKTLCKTKRQTLFKLPFLFIIMALLNSCGEDEEGAKTSSKTIITVELSGLETDFDDATKATLFDNADTICDANTQLAAKNKRVGKISELKKLQQMKATNSNNQVAAKSNITGNTLDSSSHETIKRAQETLIKTIKDSQSVTAYSFQFSIKKDMTTQGNNLTDTKTSLITGLIENNRISQISCNSTSNASTLK